MVLGNYTIHTYIDGLDGGLKHYLCLSESTEMQAYKMATSKNPDKEYFGKDTKHSERWAPETNEALQFRHKDCYWTESRLNVSLLRVCKQIYAEARHIPCGINTWSFSEPDAFHRLMTLCTSTQRQTLKTIHFEVSWYDDYEEFDSVYDGFDEEYRPTIGEWNEFLDPAIIQKLTGLRTLHLTFREQFEQPLSFIKAAVDKGWGAESLLYFSRLPLQTVTVIVMVEDADVDPDIDEEGTEFQSLPLIGRQRQADDIKSFILRDTVDENIDTMLDLFASNIKSIPSAWRFFRNYAHRKAFEDFRNDLQIN
jgi:hypothetical protein